MALIFLNRPLLWLLNSLHDPKYLKLMIMRKRWLGFKGLWHFYPCLHPLWKFINLNFTFQREILPIFTLPFFSNHYLFPPPRWLLVDQQSECWRLKIKKGIPLIIHDIINSFNHVEVGPYVINMKCPSYAS